MTTAVLSAPESVAPRATSVGILQAIGKTPLIEIDFRDELPGDTKILAKLESVNPGGSIKDRPVAQMITQALAAGHIHAHESGRRLLDSSSGNAGIAYAQLGAALGVGVTLVVPANASRERLERIAAYGAELVLTDPIEGYDHAVHTARRMAEKNPDRFWYSNQYANEDNWRAHFDGTGVEILEQVQAETGASPDAFVGGVGTGGTLTGIGRRLRRETPDVHIAAVVPEIFPGIEGLKPLGSPGDLVPEILDEALIDRRVEVTIDEAVAMSRRLAKQGLYVGPSSGAYVHLALQVALEDGKKRVVTILNDTGERYGSTGMWG